MTDGPLGILAGGGELPRRLIAACRSAARPCFVIAFEGQTDAATVEGVPHGWAALGAAGRVFELLRAANVREIVLAGAIKRPSLFDLKPDAKAAQLFARIGFRALGDDGLLRAVVDELEREGFRVIGAQDVLGTLPAPLGQLGRIAPDAQARSDIARGIEVARALGQVDVGQAVVVQQGIVLGVEAVEGTDALLARVGDLRRAGPGGVLVKIAKPAQDRRVDLPTIGIATIEKAAAAGLVGIAIEAGATLVLDLEGVIAAADAAGLFLEGLDVR
ncbi:MAG: UDP-2,3-diacylglucosamine diphosphatase LpxI, partial [Pseudomonadota bacterium]